MPHDSYPADGPRCWTAATIDSPTAWRHRLSEEAIRALEGALMQWREEGGPVTEWTPPGALVEVVRRDLEPAVEALESGRGFVVVELPEPARFSREEQQAGYWVVGQALGRPVAQNVQGTLLY